MADIPESTTDASKIKDFFQMAEKVNRLNKRKANQTETSEPVINVQDLEIAKRRGKVPNPQRPYCGFKRGLKRACLPKEQIKIKGVPAVPRWSFDNLSSPTPEKPKGSS